MSRIVLLLICLTLAAIDRSDAAVGGVAMRIIACGASPISAATRTLANDVETDDSCNERIASILLNCGLESRFFSSSGFKGGLHNPFHQPIQFFHTLGYLSPLLI
jgi:hypothetical protein